MTLHEHGTLPPATHRAARRTCPATEPYFYVTAFPLPPDPRFPALSDGGFWREHEPFVGAVLLGSTVAAARDPRAASRGFLETAIAAGRALIAPGAR